MPRRSRSVSRRPRRAEVFQEEQEEHVEVLQEEQEEHVEVLQEEQEEYKQKCFKRKKSSK